MDVPSGIGALLESHALVVDQMDVPFWILDVLTQQPQRTRAEGPQVCTSTIFHVESQVRTTYFFPHERETRYTYAGLCCFPSSTYTRPCHIAAYGQDLLCKAASSERRRLFGLTGRKAQVFLSLDGTID